MAELLLDTDMLSEAGRAIDQNVRTNSARYLAVHARLTFSIISKFDVLRGLRLKGARVQLAKFYVTCNNSRILPIDDAVIERDARLWADAINGGFPSGDADILIAATALEHDLALCTGNQDHFKWIPGLRLVDWRLP